MASPSTEKGDLESNAFAARRVIGTVRAEFSSLQFMLVESIETRQGERRQEDSRIVNNLAEIFQKTKIRRYDPKNFIRAFVTPAGLRKALDASGVTQTVLTTPAPDGSLRLLKTGSNQKLSCVEGLHRIRAAEKVLAEDDRWWTVKLYLSDCKGTSTRTRSVS
jgi:hypothetical protein